VVIAEDRRDFILAAGLLAWMAGETPPVDAGFPHSGEGYLSFGLLRNHRESKTAGERRKLVGRLLHEVHGREVCDFVVFDEKCLHENAIGFGLPGFC
jgi:hypothetical protein